MKITIGDFDAATGTVAVTFLDDAHPETPFERTVNACRTADGGYDEGATAARVDQVADGVRIKFGLGVLPAPALPDLPPPAESATAAASGDQPAPGDEPTPEQPAAGSEAAASPAPAAAAPG